MLDLPNKRVRAMKCPNDDGPTTYRLKTIAAATGFYIRQVINVIGSNSRVIGVNRSPSFRIMLMLTWGSRATLYYGDGKPPIKKGKVIHLLFYNFL